MFSILVSELTPALLEKAEYWKFFAGLDGGVCLWANIRRSPDLQIVDDGERQWLYDKLDDDGVYCNARCFPVTLSPDGTEVRLECPRMPDEVEIPEWGSHVGIVEIDSDSPKSWVLWYASDRMARQSEAIEAPTPEHYPRWTCDGVWVWSTRR